jgi:Fe-S-cluster-containing dehydrogenase component
MGDYPDLSMYFLPFQCQHCDDPACVRVCPTGASYKDVADGLIRIDKTKCIACSRCKENCPYEVNNMNQELRVMDKCTGCIDTLREGEAPACARNCSAKCIHYGDVNDPDSEVSRLLREAGEENIYTMRDEGNHPSTRYILRRGQWQDLIPQEYESMKKGWHGA